MIQALECFGELPRCAINSGYFGTPLKLRSGVLCFWGHQGFCCLKFSMVSRLLHQPLLLLPDTHKEVTSAGCQGYRMPVEGANPRWPRAAFLMKGTEG